MVRVEHVMGTMVSIHVRDPQPGDRVVDRVVAWFHEVDARFSTYRPDSEVSRIVRGEVGLEEFSQDLREVLALGEDVQWRSGGAFSVWRAGDGGRRELDPSAIVKGWSVDRAALILQAAGCVNFSINAGGDVVVRGQPEAGRDWRVGIRHPADAGKVAAVVGARDCAVATSGAYERGQHIIDPRTGEAPRGLVSMTVVGANLALADAYSTAAYVMGEDGVAWVQSQGAFEAYAIRSDYRAVMTQGFRRLLA